MPELSSKARAILAAFILIPVLIYWGLRITPVEKLPSRSNLPDHVDYYIDNAKIHEWNEKGLLVRKVETQKLEHKPHKRANFLEAPVSTQFQQNGNISMLSANHGVAMDDNSKTDFIGDVKIFSNKEQPNETVLRTEKLAVFPKQNIAETDQPVTIESANSLMQGTGMDIDFNDQILNLHSRVKGTHNNAK